MWPSRYTIERKNRIINRIADSINMRNPTAYWEYCRLAEIRGIGKKSVINIVHWNLRGTLPQIEDIEIKNSLNNSQKEYQFNKSDNMAIKKENLMTLCQFKAA